MSVVFDHYLDNIDSIEGWLSGTAAYVSHALMEYQSSIGVRGNVCEIGVHHGKYFIALAAGLTQDEQAVAIDLFADQHENLDKSGKGDRQAFDANVRRFLPSQRVVVIQGNSTCMSAEDITRHGKVRFFSIDGGHTASAVLFD